MKFRFLTCILLIGMYNTSMASNDEVVVYSARGEHLIKPLFDFYTEKTGVPITFLSGKGEALLERLKTEGANTPADVFMTVDAGNLWYAGTQDLFQPVVSEVLIDRVPASLRDPNNLWFGLSIRARTMVYNPQLIEVQELSSYEALAGQNFGEKLCLRTSKKIYTKSLVSSLIFHHGESKTLDVLKGWVSNLASTPFDSDTKIIKAVASGQCAVGMVNSYYLARILEKEPSANAKIFWANQDTQGVHVNVSGAGVLKHAGNASSAKKLLEWLAGEEAQRIYSSVNHELPISVGVDVSSPIYNDWFEVKQDSMNLSMTGVLQARAVDLMREAGYR